MKEYPIIFSTDMVKAIQERRKTMTRRVIKPQPTNRAGYAYLANGQWRFFYQRFPEGNLYGHLETEKVVNCPYGKVGNRLWVRETWAAQFLYDDYPPRDIPTDSVIFYRIMDRLKLEIAKEHRDLGKWRPSIFMPKWASRILLEITEIRVERLQEITSDDCREEGLCLPACGDASLYVSSYPKEFSKLWDSINAKRGYGWNKNPWVWAISFRRDK